MGTIFQIKYLIEIAYQIKDGKRNKIEEELFELINNIFLFNRLGLIHHASLYDYTYAVFIHVIL